MSSIPSGNGRCSFSASTVSPSSQRSNSSVVVALDRRALRPSHAPPPPPEAREGEQRPVFAERKPGRRLGRLRVNVFAKRWHRHLPRPKVLPLELIEKPHG